MVLTPSSNARNGQYKTDDDGSLNEELWKLCLMIRRLIIKKYKLCF